ncbi:MAG: endolytic transglycosylase MltG [Patescibacteria group bacterium]|jgi:UPF0755 protein
MRKLLITVGSVAAVVALGGWIAAWLVTPGHPADASFSVAAGENVDRIVARLSDRGFIRSRALFKLALRQSGLEAKLQPGNYDLAGVSTQFELIKRLTSGGVSADEFVLLIKEGWDLRDIQKRLEELGYAGAKEFFRATGEPLAEPGRSDKRPAPDLTEEFPMLASKPTGTSLEGYLFPDTYRLFKTATPEEIVQELVANLERRLRAAGLLDRIVADKKLNEILTLASIVEQEVRSPEDRRLVADLFERRLERGMALQADSTVNYVTGKSAAAASAADLQADSPFNTYQYPGLPPGPICNPGLSAVSAVLDPEPNQYWYFLTDDAGAVHYAKTFEEHVQNKARYLRR